MSSDNPWNDTDTNTPTGSPQKSVISLTSSVTPSSIKAPNLRNNSFTKTTTQESTSSDLRPLRLTQHRFSITSNSSSGSINNENKLNSVEDFQCRPMRLGSKSLSQTPITTIPDKRNSITSLTSTTTTSQRNSIASSSTSSHKRRSIQIRNLPIISPSETKRDELNDNEDMIFAICLVDFHHQRGPEIQWWKSNYHHDYTPDLFKNIPFQALPDGSHLFEETYSNFNLCYDFNSNKSIDNYQDMNEFKGDPRDLKTLFGCSCVRQVKTSSLTDEERENNKDITRSIVQKAIVVISRYQPIFTKIKEKLSIITQSYFQQDTFGNFEILEHLFDNLNLQFKSKLDEEIVYNEEENYINLNLVNSITKFKTNFMIIFKCLLLEKKILIYSNNNLEMLTRFQNNLISLIPNLINNLDFCGCPLIDYTENNNGLLTKPTSLNTTDRKSMLRFFGLPLQIFNTKNSFWNPYLPLQQLDEMKVASFMIGCSNLLFVNQASSFGIDLMVNLDTNEIKFPKNGLNSPEELKLTMLDKKFINFLINTIEVDNKNNDYVGNDDYIRYKFEDYINSLISSMRYSQYQHRFGQLPPGFNQECCLHSDFKLEFINKWEKTQNFHIWNSMADEFIFNFIDPKHIATDYQESNSKLSNFMSNFRFKSSSSPTPVSEVKIHKFIDDEEEKQTQDELVTGFEKVTTNDKKSWNWGFK